MCCWAICTNIVENRVKYFCAGVGNNLTISADLWYTIKRENMIQRRHYQFTSEKSQYGIQSHCCLSCYGFFIGIYHYSQHQASDTGGILYYIQNKSFSSNSALYDRYQDYDNRYLHSKTQKHINNVL